MTPRDEPPESLLEALHALGNAANTNLDRIAEILRRLDHIESRLAAGNRVTDVIAAEPAPRIVVLLTQNMAASRPAEQPSGQSKHAVSTPRE